MNNQIKPKKNAVNNQIKPKKNVVNNQIKNVVNYQIKGTLNQSLKEYVQPKKITYGDGENQTQITESSKSNPNQCSTQENQTHSYKLPDQRNPKSNPFV